MIGAWIFAICLAAFGAIWALRDLYKNRKNATHYSLTITNHGQKKYSALVRVDKCEEIIEHLQKLEEEKVK